jgi:hypothetical protein
MATTRVEKTLWELRVKALEERGQYEDGGGMRRVVDANGSLLREVRITVAGKRIGCGRGGLPHRSLEAARSGETRHAVRPEIDPESSGWIA